MRRFLTFILVLFLCGNVYGNPSNTMSISPIAVDDEVDEAADENARNNLVVTTYNSHTHEGIIAENALVVGATNTTYTTIQSAMNAASSGQAILVHEGTYTEQVTFTKDNIALRAIGRAEATIITQTDATTVDFSTKSGCTLAGFTVNLTAADATSDYAIASSNDSTSDYNTIEDCLVNYTTATAMVAIAVAFLDGNGIVRDTRIKETSDVATGNSTINALFIMATGTYFIYDNRIEYDQNSTDTVGTDVCIRGDGGITPTVYISNNVLIGNSLGQTNHKVQGISCAGGTWYVVGNPAIDIDAESTAKGQGIGPGASAMYIIGNFIDATTADNDAEWLTGGTSTVYATGNVVSGDGGYTAASTPYVTSNSIVTDLIVGDGKILATATAAGAMFWDGIVIGTDSLDFIMDDATHGSGVGAVYLGNATIDATFTGFHYYKLGDTDLKMGELVKLVNKKLYRSTDAQDPMVIGIYCGLTNWKDSFGNVMVEAKLVDKEYWNEAEGRYNTKKIKDHSQKVNSKTKKKAKASDYAYSVAIAGDSIHENMDNPLEGAWVCIDAGAIVSGDLLCSSNKNGYLEKQPDDLIHSYTVGQAIEDINADTKTAYIYLLK